MTPLCTRNKLTGQDFNREPYQRLPFHPYREWKESHTGPIIQGLEFLNCSMLFPFNAIYDLKYQIAVTESYDTVQYRTGTKTPLKVSGWTREPQH